ncbi:small conductance calcium-activated potassium channel [Aureococcus anophagefferens]|nr:small conductance calcium-activated potassium channel [Aureococcus anophagefferens]
MIMQAHEVEKRAHEPIKGSPMDRAEYLTWVLLLMDILSVVSIYDDDHVVAVARMNMVRNDTAFVCKCLFRGAPSRIILFWMLMILLWGTVNLRCWERTLGMADDADDFEEVLLDFAGHERQDYFHGVGDGVPNWSNAIRGPPKGFGRITMKGVTGIARLKSVKNRKELAGLLGERQFFYKERLATLATEVTGCTVEAHAKFRRALKAYNDIRERSAPSNIESNLMTVVSMLHDQNDSHSVLAAELKHISECMELIQGRVDRMEAGFKETGEMEKERKGLAVFKKKEKGNLASDAYIHRMIHRVKLKRAANAVKQFQIQSTVPKLKNTTDGREWGVRPTARRARAVAYLGGGGGGRVAPAGEAKEDDDVVRAFDA